MTANKYTPAQATDFISCNWFCRPAIKPGIGWGMSTITGLPKLLHILVWDLWSFSGFSCWNPTWQPNLLLFSLCWALLHSPLCMWYDWKFRNANEYPIPIDASNWCPNWYLGWWTLSCSSFFSLPGIYNTYTHTHTSVLWWRSCVQYWVCHVLILSLEYP
jgi:hypothetical protein